MKIHLLSDLHIEFWKGQYELKDLVTPANVLVAGGDINVGRANTIKTLKELSKHYESVVYLPGNHEYYGGLELNGFNVYSEFQYKLPNNVHFLNPGTFCYKDVTFIGATLWTNFRENIFSEGIIQKFIVDFRRIPNATIENIKNLYYQHLQYIKLMYEHMPGKKVICTHFMPATQCISERYRNKDDITSTLNHYFANDLGDWIEGLEDATWLFGHTHDSVDVTIGTTRCLANPFGYPNERNDYKPLVIEI